MDTFDAIFEAQNKFASPNLDHQDENDDADEGKEELGLLLDVLIFFSFLGFEAFWLNLIKLT